MDDISELIDDSIEKTLKNGFRTRDISSENNEKILNCDEMGDKILDYIKSML